MTPEETKQYQAAYRVLRASMTPEEYRQHRAAVKARHAVERVEKNRTYQREWKRAARAGERLQKQ